MVVKVNVNMNEQISKENAGVRPYLAAADWRGVRGQLVSKLEKFLLSADQRKNPLI